MHTNNFSVLSTHNSHFIAKTIINRIGCNKRSMSLLQCITYVDFFFVKAKGPRNIGAIAACIEHIGCCLPSDGNMSTERVNGSFKTILALSVSGFYGLLEPEALSFYFPCVLSM